MLILKGLRHRFCPWGDLHWSPADLERRASDGIIRPLRGGFISGEVA